MHWYGVVVGEVRAVIQQVTEQERQNVREKFAGSEDLPAGGAQLRRADSVDSLPGVPIRNLSSFPSDVSPRSSPEPTSWREFSEQMSAHRAQKPKGPVASTSAHGLISHLPSSPLTPSASDDRGRSRTPAHGRSTSPSSYGSHSSSPGPSHRPASQTPVYSRSPSLGPSEASSRASTPPPSSSPDIDPASLPDESEPEPDASESGSESGLPGGRPNRRERRERERQERRRRPSDYLRRRCPLCFGGRGNGRSR